ncbi:MAG: hypothetical protein GC152_00180 [Alphaproteobacteria bacterium]|nr:hypothetical protein [Alphaproteobacteria bacterium]
MGIGMKTSYIRARSLAPVISLATAVALGTAVLPATVGAAMAQESEANDAAGQDFTAKYATGAAPVIASVGKEAMTAFFAADGYSVAVEREDADAIVLREDAEGGGAFYVALLGCSDGACDVVEVFAYFNPQGVTLSAVNDAHQNTVIASTIMLDERDGIIARRILLRDGVTYGNLAAQVGAFLGDVELFLTSLTPGAAVGVSFPGAPGQVDGAQAASKIDGYGASPVIGAPAGLAAATGLVARPVRNAVGVNAPRLTRPK